MLVMCMQVLLESNDAAYGTTTVREFFKRHAYSQAFQQRYFMPMCAAVWSMPNAQVCSSLSFALDIALRLLCFSQDLTQVSRALRSALGRTLACQCLDPASCKAGRHVRLSLGECRSWSCPYASWCAFG